MDKRAKSEQFRKRRNNYFQRGYDIGITCETDMFILFKRKGKFYTFTNMDELVWPTQEEIVSKIGLKANYFKSDLHKQRNLVISKTAADFATTSRAKNNASRANKTTSSLPNTSSNVSAFSALNIKTPESPQLDLSSQRGLGGWKDFITSLM
ncbi:hypothetical protein BGZ57DRAFT_855392 [Hyaloscypha finlandica]|jgi:hypothetical protein|nr:hypothetical protein BGZ57DRAFT_855392 [Hyaloscypha finlandica]